MRKCGQGAIFKRCTILLCIGSIFLCAVLFTFSSKKKVDGVYDPYDLECSDHVLPYISTSQSWRRGLKDHLQELARSLKSAKLHARGSKTRDALNSAVLSLDESLKLLNINIDCLSRRKINSSSSVCPEIYKKDIDYPFYEDGFQTEDCPYGKANSELVTILIVHEERSSVDSLRNVYSGLRQYDKLVKTIVALPENFKDSELKNVWTEYDAFKTYGHGYSVSEKWNLLISLATTPYVLLARDIFWLNKDIRLERLVREIERLNVPSIGGASRDLQGHWNLGCHQQAIQNFSLVYKAGYDESVHDCLFCDFVDGPILLKTEIAKEVIFDKHIHGEGTFEDFFLRLGKTGQSAVCPDVMFFVEKRKQSTRHQDWHSLSSKWELSYMRLSSGTLIEFPCPAKYDCWHRDSTLIMSPCCQRELSESVDIAMDICAKTGIKCELDGGTLLGGLKVHDILPWERDADFIVVGDNFMDLVDKKGSFASKNYNLTVGRYPKCCKEGRKNGGYISLWGPHWRVEFLGQYTLDSERQIANFIPEPTKLPVNGKWYPAMRNPGLHLRNRYGKDLYHHELHGSDLAGTDLLVKERKRSFLPCKETSFSNCMFRYNADGNIQFNEPIP